ncbi:hypothetical protein HanXRQr2_Chr13g0573281 [Helianthus annuus]|uniref:Uncharacterized protein n=1 Tax=Helianthus annuus TaxID=4232 RepID=A0A251SSK5_HELAN|nr:hypothetical protein HanXRQr2_Chr13g0573281 [Helianthus annuus]
MTFRLVRSSPKSLLERLESSPSRMIALVHSLGLFSILTHPLYQEIRNAIKS